MAGSGASTPYSRPQKSSSSSSSKSKSKQMPTDRKRKRSRVDIDIDPAGSVIPAGSDLEEKTDIDRHKARKPFSTMDNLGLPRSRITDTIPTASITTIIPPSSAPVDTADNGEIDIEDLFGPEPDIDIVNPSSGPATTSKQFDNSSGKLDVDVENGQTSTSTSTSTSFLEPSYSYSDMDTDNYYGSTYASDNIDIDIDSRFKRPTINNPGRRYRSPPWPWPRPWPGS
ncbi:hypothetical protein DFH27DRAFT_578685 [Peziza echinospora]|nr:hypothetical protein DFH27DRAFT_578685 [Peziza echinospora]